MSARSDGRAWYRVSRGSQFGWVGYAEYNSQLVDGPHLVGEHDERDIPWSDLMRCMTPPWARKMYTPQRGDIGLDDSWVPYSVVDGPSPTRPDEALVRGSAGELTTVPANSLRLAHIVTTHRLPTHGGVSFSRWGDSQLAEPITVWCGHCWGYFLAEPEWLDRFSRSRRGRQSPHIELMRAGIERQIKAVVDGTTSD